MVITLHTKAGDPTSPAACCKNNTRLHESLHWGSQGCSNFYCQSRWLSRGAEYESRCCPSTQPLRSSAAESVCWGLHKQTQSWGMGQHLFSGHTAPMVPNANRTAGFVRFILENPNHSAPEICLSWLLQDLAQWPCLQQMGFFSTADGTVAGRRQRGCMELDRILF